MGQFRNAVLDLPPEIQQEINKLIDDSNSSNNIHKTLTGKYTGKFLVPSIPTIVKYVRWYNVQKHTVVKAAIEEELLSNFKDGLAEIQSLLDRTSLEKSPNFEKIKVLDGIVGKCLLRAHDMEESVEGKVHAPTTETAIIHYYSEVRKIIETTLKLSATFKEDEATLLQIINSEAKLFLEMVRDTVLEVCPEKAELFKRAFDRRLASKMAPDEAPIVIPNDEVKDAPPLAQLTPPPEPGSTVLKEPAEEPSDAE